MKIEKSDSRLLGCNHEQIELMQKAIDADENNDLSKAIILLKKVIAIRPSVPYAFGLLASIYIDEAKLLDKKFNYEEKNKCYIRRRRKLYRTAIFLLEKALDLKPDWMGAVLVSARACEQLGFLNRALRYYGLYLAANPKRADIYYDVGLIYEYRKNYHTAKVLYKKALLFDNENEVYRKRLKKMEVLSERDTCKNQKK
ncbi:hypothetical protein [Treponema pedis]|uniref:TPR protein n=1 Tax=Treponema pedis TaxID=409322 RepID=A0A7S6WRC8_9SPIR|nr:hypothetical protein [Treponema pedis]QOW61923.1 hypothetical protein IFE08_06175 [Treponema pedis]QSI04839.1 tetratricopeptide repeat protein [Treponema pedis]